MYFRIILEIEIILYKKEKSLEFSTKIVYANVRKKESEI
jgi:hypothetical protein